MNERRLNSMIEAKADWERQLLLINTTGVPGRNVSRELCVSRIKDLNKEILKEIFF